MRPLGTPRLLKPRDVGETESNADGSSSTPPVVDSPSVGTATYDANGQPSPNSPTMFGRDGSVGE